METTTNYKLPQWVKADQIKMDDFNDAFGKIESALSGHDESLNTKADTSSVTAVRQDLAAARTENCFRKLAGPIVTTAANAAMEFDLSQVDMTKVAALFLTFCAGSSNGGVDLSLNGTKLGTACSNNWSTSAGVLWLVPFLEGAAYCSTVVSDDGGSGGSKASTAVSWADIRTLTLSGSSKAGATATLYVLKR